MDVRSVLTKTAVGLGVSFMFFLYILPSSSASAGRLPDTSDSDVVVFVREGCGHCVAAEEYFDDLTLENVDLVITYYHLEDTGQQQIWDRFTTEQGISKVTPIIVIGDRYLVGFDTPDTTGADIEKLLKYTSGKNIPTDLNDISGIGADVSFSTCDEEGIEPCAVEESVSVNIPFIGAIDTNQYPLIVLSALLGFFDGFNPCAMWVLVTFLIILMQIGNRRKMLLFVGVFILAEAIMYSLILGAWFTTWDFVRLDSIVTPIVGVISIGGGIFFLREWRKKELACKITNPKQRANTRNRIKQLATEKFTIVTLLGILTLAFSVNIIEFACSIGIPQAFTKILQLNALSGLHTAWYIGIYILFYMIDDLIVFGIALWGIDKLALTTKYSKLSNLFGGIVMIILGLLLIFAPQVLRF